MKHCEEADGLMAPDKDTDGFVFNHLMLRIKDPKKTLNFYSKLMGMRLIKKFDFPTMKFSLYFLGNLTDEEIANVPKDNFDRSAWTFTQKGMLEFTHNWGSENDDKVKFHDGNAEPKGFGHICFSVPDIYAACKKFEENGVEFVKKPDDGSMKGLAFIKDPVGVGKRVFESIAGGIKAAFFGILRKAVSFVPDRFLPDFLLDPGEKIGKQISSFEKSTEKSLKKAGKTSAAADKAQTEAFDGTSWTEIANLGTARTNVSGTGSATTGMAIGGQSGPPTQITTVEETTVGLGNKTITAS